MASVGCDSMEDVKSRQALLRESVKWDAFSKSVEYIRLQQMSSDWYLFRYDSDWLKIEAEFTMNSIPFKYMYTWTSDTCSQELS